MNKRLTGLSNRLGIRLLLILIISCSYGAFTNRLVNPADYLYSTVTSQTLVTKILAEGRVHAFKTVTVGAQVSGQLQKLHVQLGDQVTKGSLLAEIDPTLQQNTLLSCQAQIRNVKERIVGAQAKLKFTQDEYQRNQKLVEKKLVAESNFEEAKTNYIEAKSTLDALQAELEAAKVNLSTAQINLGYTKIMAPIDGMVSDIITEEGQTVVSTQTASSILVLQDLSQVTIKAELPEAEVIKAKPGQEVYFSIIGDPDHRYYSTLRMIEPAPTTGETDEFSDAAVYYFGLFEVANSQRLLRPGMTVEVSVILSTTPDTLTIPVNALGAQLAGDRYLVTVLTPWHTLNQREVVVGQTDNDFIQVLKGLRKGEKVILSNNDNSNSDTNASEKDKRRTARKVMKK